MEKSGYTLLGPPTYKDAEAYESASAPVLQDFEISHLLPVPGYRPSLVQANPSDPINTEPRLETVGVPLVCPYCRLHVQSRVIYKPGRKAHYAAACLGLLCLWCFIVLPYVSTNLLKAEHYCGSCGGLIGTYND